MLTYYWLRRGQKIMFNFPVSSPFIIIHVYWWMSDHHTYSDGYTALINVMCYMSQFVVIFPVPNESSATLGSYFIQHILIKFDLCHLVVLDYGAHFKGSFIAICEALNLNYDIFTKSNHKSLTIEHFHHFFNKSVTIVAEERDTNNISVSIGITVSYAWNSALIYIAPIYFAVF